MQNKHCFFFPFWESQRSGRGGGSSRLGQNPNFYQKFVLEASLTIGTNDNFKESVKEGHLSWQVIWFGDNYEEITIIMTGWIMDDIGYVRWLYFYWKLITGWWGEWLDGDYIEDTVNDEWFWLLIEDMMSDLTLKGLDSFDSSLSLLSLSKPSCWDNNQFNTFFSFKLFLFCNNQL